MIKRGVLAVTMFLAMLSVFMAVPVNCAHVSPTAFVNCMKDSAAGAALINAVNNILDGDNRTQVLEQLAIAIGPDVLACALQQIASTKATTPAGTERARRAREYLDAHGGQA
jgi:hypothetical protein